MYIPRANEERRIPVIHALIASQPLAALVTLGAGGLLASHLPMILEEDGSEFGILKGHVSRANTQWRDLMPSVDALAIFAGPHHYISPSWYREKEEHGKVVPTWNYAVVHAYGPLTVIEDGQWLFAHLETLTNTHEAGLPLPWKVGDAPEAFIRSMMEGIVGLELPIRRLEGKWKVSQNRSQADRKGVVEGLSNLNTPESLAMKALVEEALRKE
jgi:transcriptional regulator